MSISLLNDLKKHHYHIIELGDEIQLRSENEFVIGEDLETGGTNFYKRFPFNDNERDDILLSVQERITNKTGDNLLFDTPTAKACGILRVVTFRCPFLFWNTLKVKGTVITPSCFVMSIL